MAVDRSPRGDLPTLASDTARTPLVRRVAGALVGRRMWLAGTVYLCLDLSASMADPGKMPQLVRGSVRFFYEAWRRDYAIGLVGFGSTARVLTGATRDPHRFQRCMSGLEPNGRTAMARALHLAAARLRFRRGRRVILLITDGMPDSREATLDAAAAARAAGMTVIAVGTDDADEAFLSALTPRPELARVVSGEAFGEAIGDAAGRLVSDRHQRRR
ncbi:MAG: VWA domain-containing protein [Deinococcales bacterium]|jgi:Mg-chelatase subunit ChlD